MHCNDENFIHFMKQNLLFHKIIEVKELDNQTAELILDNNIILKTYCNIVCGGCSSGWYYLTHLTKSNNIITNVELVVEEVKDSSDVEERYSLFVLTEDERLNLLSYEGWDNGYYGVGFTVEVIRKEIK